LLQTRNGLQTVRQQSLSARNRLHLILPASASTK